MSEPVSHTPFSREMALLLLLLVMVAWIYAPVPGLDFFDWDDTTYIVDNPMVSQGVTWEGVRWSLTYHNPFVITLTWLSYMAEVSLAGGVNPGVFHLDNVILHLLNVGLVYLLVRSLTKSKGMAWVVSALMALHPQHVEAVVWIAERKELLAFLFGMGTLLCYVKHLAIPPQRIPGNFWLFAAVGMFLLSLLSKPQWITLPFLLLLLDYWPLERQKVGWQRLVVEKWPFFLLTLLFSTLTILAHVNQDRLTSLAEISLDHRLINSLYGLSGQLAKSFWPTDLAVLYPTVADSMTMAQVWWRGGVLLLITLAVLATSRRKPHLAMGWLWFLGGLFPTLGLVNGGVVVGMGDRWSIMPHLGLFLALVHEGHGWLAHWRKSVVLAVTALLLSLALLTSQQISKWANSETLWHHTIQATQPWPNPHAHWLLGLHYRREQRLAEATRHMTEAQRLKPNNPYYVQSLAQLHLVQGQTQQGYDLLNLLLTIPNTPRDILMMMGMGMVLDKNYHIALRFLTRALENPPSHDDANYTDALLYTSLALSGTQELKRSQEVFTFFIAGNPTQQEHRCRKAMTTLDRSGPEYPEFTHLRVVADQLCHATSSKNKESG